MTAWCHLPTIFNKHFALRIAGLIALCVALTTTLIFSATAQATAGINQTLSFQGRLLTSTGGVVPDGFYNMQFKLYQDGSGTTAGNVGGSLKWTEDYVNNNANNGVTVKDGYFSVNLGSATPFGTSVDWNQNTLWLSMNIAGSSASCTTFDSGTCAADGEMLPMKRINAVPTAINSSLLEGKKADNFIQLAQGVQTDASTNTSSLFINKTGSGNLLQLQKTATDVFTINNDGDLQFGSANHSISLDTAITDTNGGQLALTAGTGGAGSGSDGGSLTLQGGAAGGTNGNGGDVNIDAGAGTGTGTDGTISIGTTSGSTVNIGSTSVALSQNINIGANDTVGSTTNVIIGNGGSADSGVTTVQAKNTVTIATNGQTRATFSDTANTVYFGNGVSATAPSDYTIQGTNSSASAVAGGSLTVQGGSATTGNANGGNVTISGGNGVGTGTSGLVVLTTPTFSTVTNDVNCYASGAAVASSCTIATSSVDNSSAALVGFSVAGQTATLPDPTITTAGRIFYVMSAGTSNDFTLSINGGGSVGNLLTVHPGTAATLLWNGTDWVNAGASSSTTLQEAYNNTPLSAGSTELTLQGSTNANGLTIRNSSTDPVNNSLLAVQSSTAANLFSVNGQAADTTNVATDGTVNDGVGFSTNWTAVGTASATRITTDGQEAGDSAQVVAGTASGNGIRNKLASSPAVSSSYHVSVYAKLASGSDLSDFTVRYTPDGGTTFVDCTGYNSQTISTSGWTQITCDITTGPTTVTDPYVYFTQPTTAASARTFLVDNFSLTSLSTATPNVKVGTGTGTGQATLFTVDKSATAPTASSSEALLGSMYYDTTLGKLQCYEAAGWGSCGSSPDDFVTISPEYTNAVINGIGTGTMSSDLCSDTLNINDGSSGQPNICGTDETYNFYKWTSAETTAAQTRSIYVTYQLPSDFKNFVAGSTSLLGRTDSTNSQVAYQIYRNSSSDGLVSCGTSTTVSTGTQTAWQKSSASGSADPSNCSFAAGDSIVIKISLTAQSDSNAYVSSLGFTYSNN